MSINFTSSPISTIAKRTLKAGWSVDIETDVEAMYGSSMIGSWGVKLISSSDFQPWIKCLYKVFGIQSKDDGYITVYKRGKMLAKRITKDEFMRRYFVDML